MPRFASDFGHGDPGTAYSALLSADAAGALTGGLLLESGFRLFRPAHQSALILAFAWACALAVFALTHSYPLALGVLFCAGFFELSFSSMVQTIVQLEAPPDIRGRVLGLFSMSSLGLRTFSGVTVGIIGSIASVHTALAVAAAVFAATAAMLLVRSRSLPRTN